MTTYPLSQEQISSFRENGYLWRIDSGCVGMLCIPDWARLRRS